MHIYTYTYTYTHNAGFLRVGRVLLHLALVVEDRLLALASMINCIYIYIVRQYINYSVTLAQYIYIYIYIYIVRQRI